MKVQNVFHIICGLSNVCILFYFFSPWAEVGNAVREGRLREGVKNGSRLPGAYLQSVAPCTFQPWNFTAMKLCFCISVGEHAMLTYLCALIAQLAVLLTDCLTGWLSGGMTIWPSALQHNFFLTRLLPPCTRDPWSEGCSGAAVAQGNSAYAVSFGQNYFSCIECPGQRPSLLPLHTEMVIVLLQKDYQTRSGKLPHLSLLTSILLECGSKASSVSSSNFRLQTV